jgi:hypothetical protein
MSIVQIPPVWRSTAPLRLEHADGIAICHLPLAICQQAMGTFSYPSEKIHGLPTSLYRDAYSFQWPVLAQSIRTVAVSMVEGGEGMVCTTPIVRKGQ